MNEKMYVQITMLWDYVVFTEKKKQTIKSWQILPKVWLLAPSHGLKITQLKQTHN